MGATSPGRLKFEDYHGFVEKFKPKRTTDDCYTPPEIYDVVADYVTERWGVDRADMVRPFWPGGDFEGFDYPDGCCVVDNPPFSILARIKRFYTDAGVPFFLFCPQLTSHSGVQALELTTVVADANITYANGACVLTAFVTNLPSPNVVESVPELGDAINEASERLRRAKARHVEAHEYPVEVLTAARVGYLAAHHTPFAVRRGDCTRINKLDAMGKRGIFGGALLLSERAAAERAAVNRWSLSDRERAVCAALGSAGEASANA